MNLPRCLKCGQPTAKLVNNLLIHIPHECEGKTKLQQPIDYAKSFNKLKAFQTQNKSW